MARRFARKPANAELRVYFIGFVILCGLAALLAKLWYEQVLRGPRWTAKLAGRSEVTVRVPSVRGEIRDRNGLTLVGNRASYEVDFYLPDMVRGYRRQMGSVPLTEYLGTVRQMKKKLREPDIVRIVNESVVPRLHQLQLARDYNSERLQKHFRNDTEVPFTYLEEIDFPTIAKFSEHNVGLPGVEISVKPVRQYIYGALAAHLLGYVGAPLHIDALPDVKDYSFYQPDVDGKSQIEASMDKYLRGEPGTRVLQRSVKGVIEGEVRMKPPKPGNNVFLTLDARAQYIVEQALRHPSLGRAAAVVIDPNNGDILAMGSVPSFDPNVFIPSISEDDWKVLNDDPAVPLVSRAVSGFPPGSTFKIITALGGLRKNMGGSHFNCPGGVQYGDHYFKCWIAEKHGQHGTLGLADALKVSCDSFFYQYGNTAGIDSLDRIGKILGIGEHYDLGLADEKDGAMPGPEWMKLRYPQLKWTSAHTANVSIGQGYVLASPLQMAMAYAAVANGGIAYEPRLVKKVLTPDGRPVLDDHGQVAVPDEPKIRGDLSKEVSAQQIEIVRHGLWEVINERGGPGGGGTGAKAQLKGVTVAGKTGTAQATDRGKKDTIAWFCCFAPYEKPRYVICAMVQGGHHGGSVAAPIAAHILEQLLAMDQGSLKVEVASLTPARNKNPFAGIEALTPYKDSAAITLTSEEDSAEEREPSDAKVEMERGTARPDIRAAADARGRVLQKAPKPPPPTVVDKRNIFQRFFGIRPAAPAPKPAPAPFRPGGR
ncbi:MAG: penicillin-binding protein 2 [Chthoniobacter sp.]|jgi:penicillin-binding protein 2|nr:penicillin-binding protein 2 [Chthoniobacter sp.]